VLPAAACDRKPTPARVEAAASASGCTYPIVVRDDRGVQVVVREEPHRIASLLPSHTETLLALGLGSALVGVDDYSDELPGAPRLPRLGGLYDARVEALLALQPDLVVLSETSPAAAPVERSGVSTWGGSPARFADIPRVIAALGELVCRREEAARIVQRIADDTADVERRTSGLARVRVYYEVDASLYTVGPRSFLGAMIAKAGGEDIVPEGLGDFPKISPEAVIAADPAVIFGATLDDVRARPGWDGITAVRTGRVFKLGPGEGGLVTRPGPRIAEGLRVLLHHIHPELSP
jgi:iron complex transport system substrate-binding protein